MTKSSPSGSKSKTELNATKHFKRRPSGEMMLLITRYRIQRVLKKLRGYVSKKASGASVSVLHDDVIAFWGDVETRWQHEFGRFTTSVADGAEIRAYLNHEKKRRREGDETEEVLFE